MLWSAGVAAAAIVGVGVVGSFWPAVVALLKQVYVEVATDSFALGGKPPTDSRVSMLTGVHRKDVRTLRPDSPAAEAAALMVDHKIGSVPVVDQTMKLVGIVTETDFVRLAYNCLDENALVDEARSR